MIHWSGMDVGKEEVREFLGIESQEDPYFFAKPLSQQRRTQLWLYIKRHEAEEAYTNSEGLPCLLANKRLVFLENGAGFGELALMSDTKRMSTCKAEKPCTLGVINRQNFGSILKKAQKRRIQEQI